MAGGRPTKYKAEYAEQAYKFCLLGATDARLAEFFDVDEATINRWKDAHTEFCESIKRGKDVADAEIAYSLFQRAKGYSHPEIVTASFQGQITDTMEVIKHYPPDTGAAMAWLKNRDSTRWRDKQEVDLRTPDGLEVLKDDELRAGIEKTIRAITVLSERIGTPGQG